EGKFERILAVSKCFEGKMLKLLCFKLKDCERFLKISEGHFVYVERDKMKMRILAKNVNVRDKLYVMMDNFECLTFEIDKINKEVADFLVNVRTESSDVVVNGILCSTETE